MTRQVRLAIGAVIALMAAICVYATRQVDPDLFGYLDYGRLFMKLGGPTTTDPFAFTSGGSYWVDFEYLAQMVLWIAYDHFGPLGLIGVKLVLGGGAIFCLWTAVRATSDDLFVSAPVFLLCASTVSRYFIFRPQLFTFAFFALFVAVLFQFIMTRKAALWLLPLVMLVWVNAHGGFVAGLGAVALATIVFACANVNTEGKGIRTAFRRTKPLMVTLAACVVSTFLNPWGIRQWGYVLTELSHGTNRRYIAEWSPAGLHVDPWSWTALTVIAATLVGVGWMAQRQRHPVAGLHPWQWVLSACPLIAMAYLSVRHVPLAAIWAAPVITLLGTAVHKSPAMLPFRRFWLAVSSVSLIPILLTLQYVAEHPEPVIAMGGTTLGAKDPCHVVEFMKEAQLRGNVYNPLWWGSYITWELYPAIRVSMDGRNISLFPDSMVEENLKFYSREATADDVEDPFRYNTDFLVVPSDAAVLSVIRSDGRWRQLHGDDDALLFVRSDSAHTSIVSAAQAGSVGPSKPCPQVLK